MNDSQGVGLRQTQSSMEASRHGLGGVRGVEAPRGRVALSIRLWLARGLAHSSGGTINYSGGRYSFRPHTLRFAGERESDRFTCDLGIAAILRQHRMRDHAAGETRGIVPRETNTRCD